MLKKINRKEPDTRQKILSAAFNLFAQRGMRDISMREIAQACGVTKPVIYYYFKDKDALCFEIAKDFGGREEEKLLSIAAENPDFAKFLEKLFASYLGREANKNMVYFMTHLHSYASSNPRLAAALKRQSYRALLGDILRGHAQKGAFARGRLDIAKHLIIANIMHMVLSGQYDQINFKQTYPAEIAKAVLKAIDYKGEIK